ncbi:MAG: Gfo/Idh/MocA family oxidoreductase [Geodermatophilaceae bacterium]|nr:Gfo/Idh/MocA family oxidoreductase [Geodermatophilaceae bacterium]
MTVGWGFLGAGQIASRALGPAVHAADGAVLQAVAARDIDRAAALEPAGSAYDDYRALLADREVDVVYVALPNDDHLPWTVAALAAGKHVLCEKPLGLDAAQVAQIASAATTSGCLAVEATWYRWHPRSIRSQQLLQAGSIGEPRSLATAFCFGGVPAGNYRLEPARGGGAWYDVGCYGVSAAHLLLGAHLAVEAASRRLGPTGVDLETRASLRTPAGATAEVVASIDAPEYQDLTTRGTLGSLSWSAPQLTSWREPAMLTISTPDADPVVERFPAVDAYRLMVEQVSRCVSGEEEPVVSLAESLRVATTMDAVTVAAASGT